MIRRVGTAVISLLAFASVASGEFVLLHNGSLLEGDIRQTPDEVVVHQPGGAIRLRAVEVVHVDESPLAIYSWLRVNRIGPRGSSDEHLALADWAIDNRLWPQAARELLDARQIDPRSRRLAVLERRFDEMTRPRPTAPAEIDSGVVVASYEETVQAASEAESEEPLPRMPEDAVEFFTRRVQPLLRHGCATAGCHGGEEGDRFQLDPSWLRGHGDSRSTDRNLRTTLSAIDLGSPANSQLLQAAAGPHYGATPISGPRREELLERLSAWVHSIASLNPQDLPPPPGDPVETFDGASTDDPSAATIDQGQTVEPAAFEAPLGSIVRGGAVRRVGPRDEFDPAIFNERFRRPEDDQPLDPLNGPPSATR